MLKTFISGLLFLITILFTTNTAYSYLLTYTKAPSYEHIQEIVDKTYGKAEVSCIIEAVYFEARGESEEGHKAIVEVIKNRSENELFPNTFCGVVQQNKQFSYRNGDKKNHLVYTNKEKKEEITKTVYTHLYDLSKKKNCNLLPECVSHYDGKAFTKPAWAYKMNMVQEIGMHQFYCKKEA